jgi:hypothetical protein
MLTPGTVTVEGFGAIDGDGGELGVEFLEDGFRETGSDVADGFVGVGVAVVAGEQEGAVDGGAFAFSVVGAQDDKIEGVANAGEVVFFNLSDCQY